jgi:hypothetical protein
MSWWKKLVGGKQKTAQQLFQEGVNYRARQDWVMAADFIRQAADMGHAEAQFNYALMCMRGDGVTLSESEGIRWMQKSAENGFPQAQKNVDILKRSGHIQNSSAGAPPPQQPAQNNAEPEFTDPRDGHVYRTVVISGRVWMAENLAFETPKGSWIYDEDNGNLKQYGRLYDWPTAQQAVPEGWHLPSLAELRELTQTVGSSPSAYLPGASSGFEARLGGVLFGDLVKASV